MILNSKCLYFTTALLTEEKHSYMKHHSQGVVKRVDFGWRSLDCGVRYPDRKQNGFFYRAPKSNYLIHGLRPVINNYLDYTRVVPHKHWLRT